MGLKGYKMELNKVIELFDTEDKYGDENEFLKFERVENKFHKRHDIHAFILLSSLPTCREEESMISGAEHDQIYLNVDMEEFAEFATEDMITELTRCGVFYDEEWETLSMFV